MTPAERETILRTDDARDTWTIWSAKGSRQARRLLKRCTPVREDAAGYWLTIPLAWVRVVPSHRRALTAEQRRAIGARLTAARRMPADLRPGGPLPFATLLRNFISFYHSCLPRSGMAVSPKFP